MNADFLSRRFLFGVSKTTGRSMRPLIWGKDHYVVVTPLTGEPEIGDMLLFEHRSPDGRRKNIVHRLVDIRPTHNHRYVMRGDNNLLTEEIDRGSIIGRVAEIHRLSGYRPWHAIAKRSFAVTDPAYRRYVRLWTALTPLRLPYYRLRNFLRKSLYPLLPKK